MLRGRCAHVYKLHYNKSTNSHGIRALALDPREGQQIQTKELAPSRVLKLVAPRDLHNRMLSVNTSNENKRVCALSLTMRSGNSGLSFGWYSSFHVRISPYVLAVLPVFAP